MTYDPGDFPDELIPMEDAIGFALYAAGLPEEFSIAAYLRELDAVRVHNTQIKDNTTLFGRRKDRP